MPTLIDRTFTWQGTNHRWKQQLLWCRVRIFRPHPEVQVVIVSEPQSSTGFSISVYAELLATAITAQFDLDPTLLLWIEHYPGGMPEYPDEEFDAVRFQWLGRKAWRPRWTATTRQSVELAIGQLLAEEG